MARKLTLREEISYLADQFFSYDSEKRHVFEDRLLYMCNLVKDKDFMLIHNPGGWGSTHVDNLLQWERSIVDGVRDTIDNLGYSWVLMQYFRSELGWRAVIGDIREQMHFFHNKARLMAAELKFITDHFESLRVIMIGVSQGAAFSNAVAQNLNGLNRLSSIELGTPFYYKSKRIISEKTLVLDSNGLMPDALMEWDVPTILKAYFSAPFRWLKYRLQGKKVKFTNCINVPGHDYNWEHPEVQRQVEDFINTKFGKNRANRDKEVEAG